MAERHRQFWNVSSWLVEEEYCDSSAYSLSLWLMTSSAAAGWRRGCHSNQLATLSLGRVAQVWSQLGFKTSTHYTPTPWPVSVSLSLSAAEHRRSKPTGRRQKVMEMLRKYPRNSQWERSLTCLAVNGTWCMKACRESPPLVINLKLPLRWTDLPTLHKGQFSLSLKIPQKCDHGH